MCITLARGSSMRINCHTTREIDASKSDASKSDTSKTDASNLKKADASILKLAEINFA